MSTSQAIRRTVSLAWLGREELRKNRWPKVTREPLHKTKGGIGKTMAQF